MPKESRIEPVHIRADEWHGWQALPPSSPRPGSGKLQDLGPVQRGEVVEVVRNERGEVLPLRPYPP